VKIAFVGGGAIGSYYAGMLDRAGHSVTLITRGEHLRAVGEHGLLVRTPNDQFVAHPAVGDDRATIAGCEYVIVSVKGYSIDEIAPMVAAAARGGSVIVPLLNGVDAAERLEAAGVPRAAIVGGLATISVFRTTPGVVERRSPFDRIVVGEIDRVARDRSTRLATALKAAGVDASASDDMPRDLWRKFALIVPMTVVSGLTRQPMGAALSTERGRALIARTLSEIVAVSRAGSTRLDDADESKLRTDLLSLPAGTRPSFLADLERGGPTELELLAGAVSRMGRERGVATPIHDVATAVFEAVTRHAA
jgi:2-dehydropantoate 2-reductase